jgi:hypothetical protein
LLLTGANKTSGRFGVSLIQSKRPHIIKDNRKFP